jgi:dethiobiotin synthetase
MHKSLFITGTDTGVGKTYVTVGLISALKEMGLNVSPMKPVETGCRRRGGKLFPSDTFKLIHSSGSKETIDRINPYRFRHPLAPSVAAEIEGIVIKKKRIISAYKYLHEKYDITLVEGAGGVMVPVYKRYLFIDLIKDLNAPALIVSRPGLGTINHTLLTIDALRAREIDIIGVVINYSLNKRKGLSDRTNPEVLERIGGVPVLGIVPFSVKAYAPGSKKVFDHIGKNILSVL